MTALPASLAGSLTLDDYLDAVGRAVKPHGFAPESTLAAVSICRDELTQHLTAAVEARWGAPFSLGGLGGIPTTGRTGWGAGLAHVPTEAGRGKALVICLSHIGVEPEPGMFERRGQASASTTCGAAAALLAGWGKDAPEPQPHEDNEAAMMRALVEREVDSDPADIIDLTLAVAAAATAEANRQLDALAPWDSMDVAVLGGVQIHTADGDLVLPTSGQYRTGPGAGTELTLG